MSIMVRLSVHYLIVLDTFFLHCCFALGNSVKFKPRREILGKIETFRLLLLFKVNKDTPLQVKH